MNIVLVDDDDVISLVHREVFRRVMPTAEIQVFRSGIQLLEQIQNDDTFRFDVLFLDIRMPELDGFEVLDRLEHLQHSWIKDAHVFVLSSTLDERDLNRAKEHYLVDDFIGKPLTFSMIEQILAKISTNN
jgi:CheY-like chemotaxis protein